MTEVTEPNARAGVPAELTISVVIPTRNRRESLERALRALACQTRPPDEVIVVDSSDDPEDGLCDDAELQSLAGGMSVAYVRTDPGVCGQRNIGIRAAHGSHVFLCDDDIEAAPEYLAAMARYLEQHPDRGAVTGILDEPSAPSGAGAVFPVPSFRHLLFSFLFQLSVMADVEAAQPTRMTGLPLAGIKRWYRRLGNGWSLAGWPLLTQVGASSRTSGSAVAVAIYGLGGALVRRDWLLASPYDERLGPHGIGDNYGVAIGFPGPLPVSLLPDLPVLHHRESENRLDHAEAYFQRVLALDYFVRTSDRFPRWTPAWLAWSLLGNAALFSLRRRRDLARRSLDALKLVLTSRNPLLQPAPTVPEAVASHPAP